MNRRGSSLDLRYSPSEAVVSAVMSEAFTSRLAKRILDGQPAAVIGLDPRLDALPAAVLPGAEPVERIRAFYRELMPLLARYAPAVKPNIAFFEAYGAKGYALYEETCALAREQGLLVVGDIKRGDIGSTAEAYAEEHFRHADAVTLHPYLGIDSVEPFLRRSRETGQGVFILVRTSNPSATEFQALKTPGGTVSEAVADAVTAWGRELTDEYGYSAVGAVTGATYVEELKTLRERMPQAWFLIPGVGAQGGKVADLAPAFDDRGLGALINQSRGILQCFDPAADDPMASIEAALIKFSNELKAVRPTS